MRWEPHYTGIEIFELGRFVRLYLQRDRMSRQLTFIRLDLYRFYGFGWMRYPRPRWFFNRYVWAPGYVVRRIWR